MPSCATLVTHSFSGGTLEHPGLLKYSCDLRTNVRLLPPARVLLPAQPSASPEELGSSSSSSSRGKGSRACDLQQSALPHPEERSELLNDVLGGKPLLAMAFDNMEVRVAVTFFVL